MFFFSVLLLSMANMAHFNMVVGVQKLVTMANLCFFLKTQKFLSTFFLGLDQIDFPSSPKAVKGTFLRILTKKIKNCVFSARAAPLKLVHIGAKGAFRKSLESVTKNGYLKKDKGGRIPEGKRGVRPSPPPR